MKQPLKRAHFVDSYLQNATNPIIVNLIGAGGNGGQMLSALRRINHSLLSFGHPGLFVRLFDADVVTEANLGRQLFAEADLGKNKANALINRFNRFSGTDWKAIPYQFSKRNLHKLQEQKYANITITCVDEADTRFEIADILKDCSDAKRNVYRPIYWIDFGNAKDSGQMLVGTIDTIEQPRSKKYQTVGDLPFITVEFKELLKNAKKDNTPSCSLAEALTEQDLFVNSALVQTGSSLLWKMFSEGVLFYRGFFQNLNDLKSNPISV
ncbi:MAG: PRTRC system ThiF family protein [Chitinophagaceae bacterium]